MALGGAAGCLGLPGARWCRSGVAGCPVLGRAGRWRGRSQPWPPRPFPWTLLCARGWRLGGILSGASLAVLGRRSREGREGEREMKASAAEPPSTSVFLLSKFPPVSAPTAPAPSFSVAPPVPQIRGAPGQSQARQQICARRKKFPSRVFWRFPLGRRGRGRLPSGTCLFGGRSVGLPLQKPTISPTETLLTSMRQALCHPLKSLR